MKIIDISHDIMTTELYSGTVPPRITPICSISQGDFYNLSSIEADLHTGTHVDAQSHFFVNGRTIDQMPLERYVGNCYVWDLSNVPFNPHAFSFLQLPSNTSILLLKNQRNRFLDVSLCKLLCEKGVTTIGTDALSLSPESDERTLHTYLLSNDVGIIEKLNLEDVPEGFYFLVAPPIKIKGAEAAFARAILIEF